MRYVLPGRTEVSFVTTAADYTTITAAECNAGQDLTGFCRGIPNIPETGNTADASDLSSLFNKRNAASYGGDNMTLEMYRDDSADTAHTTLPRGTSGYIVIARQGLATPGTFAVGDKVDVYPVEIISRGNGQPGRDEDDFFTALAAIFDVPVEAYAIAS